MNARILRKWSIHTKNLMSCSVCSLVVVVLLLLVTCAPSLILATMNFRSDASFTANPPHMPKNVIKEATLSETETETETETVTLSSSATSSLLSSLLLLPNRNHRLASSSAVVEVVKTPDNNREPFPGYYKNLEADDTPQMSQVSGYLSANVRNRNSDSSGLNIRGLMFSNNRNIMSKHAQQQEPLHSNNANSSNMLHLRGWPLQHATSYNDGIKSISFTKNDKVIYNNGDAGDNEKDTADQKVSYIRNKNNPKVLQQTTNHNFQMQREYNNQKGTDDRIHYVAPSSLSFHIRKASTAPTTSAHLKQLELIHSNINNLKNSKNILSTSYNESKPEEENLYATDNSNLIKIKSSSLPLRFIIESYEVPATLPLTRKLTEQQRLVLIQEQHLRQLRTMKQQAARSRRDSLRARHKSELHISASSSLSYRNFPSTHYKLRQHQNQYQQRMRKHSRRYCSARDPAQLAFEAPTVFEGKIVSMTPDRRQNFSATVEVREVFKQQIGYRLQKYLRLQFAYHNNSGECDIYREQLRPRGLVRGDTIEPGRIYLLFVQQIDIGNFTVLGQPIRKTKRVVEAVRYAVSGNYAQLASIKSISATNRTVENGQELRIVCRVTGRPPPKVTWFKDHRSINRNRKLYQFSHYKKRSELIIRSFNISDAGRYECRAKNKVNRNVERRAIVIKAYPVQRFDPNPRGTGNNCPDDASEFCFNGGTCKFFSEIGSYSCICPEGFIGERCDRKEVNNMPPSTYSNEHECGENKYLGSYYC